VAAEHFQHSGDTISRVFHEVLNTISACESKGLAYDIIRPRDPESEYVPMKGTCLKGKKILLIFF